MEQYTSFEDVYLDSSWVTIGSFDGVHRGHQAIIHRLVDGAHKAGAQAVVVTFSPHPAVVLRGLKGPFFLTDPDERIELLAGLGVDALVTLTFDRKLASRSAADFVRDLCTHLGLRRLLVGYDFALGKGREGDVPTLTRLGEEMGYRVEVTQPVTDGDDVISSSRIRALLSAGDVATAGRYLGRPYSLTGIVVHGDGRGHGLGIPTANLETWPERIVPAVGVYATLTYVRGRPLQSVTNIGVRPTFEDQPASARVETHLLDFHQDLYGQKIRMEFIQFLRREQRFSSIEALLDQIHQDIQHAREALPNAG